MSRKVIRASFWCVNGKVKFSHHGVFPGKPCNSVVHPSVLVTPPVICSTRRDKPMIFVCNFLLEYNYVSVLDDVKLQITMLVCTLYL